MQCLFASPSPAVVVVPQYNNSVNIFRSIHSSTFPGICPPHPWVEECHTHTFRTLGLLKFCCCLLADRCPPTNEPTLFSHQLSTHFVAPPPRVSVTLLLLLVTIFSFLAVVISCRVRHFFFFDYYSSCWPH